MSKPSNREDFLSIAHRVWHRSGDGSFEAVVEVVPCVALDSGGRECVAPAAFRVAVRSKRDDMVLTVCEEHAREHLAYLDELKVRIREHGGEVKDVVPERC